jgi:dolichol-phosphate mannosyltransferase
MLATIAQSREKVCIVIPLCNDELKLLDLRRRLQDLQTQDLQKNVSARFQLSFVVISDGSTAKTCEMLPSAVPSGVLYTAAIHSENRGEGVAFGSGFAHAWDADFVRMIDADCIYGPEHFLRMVGEVRGCAADVIVASPYHPEGAVEGVQAWRLALSKQCSKLYRIAPPLRPYTFTSIFRVYRGAVERDVRFQTDDFISAVEIPLSAAARSNRVSEVPLILQRRLAGVSKMSVLSTICGYIKLLFECLLAGHRAPRRLCAYKKTELIYAR